MFIQKPSHGLPPKAESPTRFRLSPEHESLVSPCEKSFEVMP